jgi:hypothetical protein
MLSQLQIAQAKSVEARTRWLIPSLRFCREQRASSPSIATATLAARVSSDATLGAPSPERVRKVIEGWERDGRLPRRQQKSAVVAQKQVVESNQPGRD